MDIILIGLIVFGLMHAGIPLVYIFWMRNVALRRPWNVRVDRSFMPTVSIILPTYNEQEVIFERLRNLQRIIYPKDLVEVIVVDSASEDNTVSVAKAFASENPELKIMIIEEDQRRGKSKAMNLALQFARGDVVITTDADSYWAPDVLQVILPYLGDPSIGAVTGTQVLLNPHQTSATRTEVAYHNAYEFIRIGESKIKSTLVMQGELTAYKRQALEKFDETSGADDTGTAVTAVQKGFRCIQISEARFHMYTYYTWRGKAIVKIRKAQQIVELWLRCLFSFLAGRLWLPALIIIPEVYLHVVNPIVGVLFWIFAFLVLVRYPILILLAFALLAYSSTRRYLLSFIVHNGFLLIGWYVYLKGGKEKVWKKVQETRIAAPSTLALYIPRD